METYLEKQVEEYDKTGDKIFEKKFVKSCIYYKILLYYVDLFVTLKFN